MRDGTDTYAPSEQVEPVESGREPYSSTPRTGDAVYQPSRRAVLKAMAAGSVVPVAATPAAGENGSDELELFIMDPDTNASTSRFEEGEDLLAEIFYDDLSPQYHDLGVYTRGSVPGFEDLTEVGYDVIPGTETRADGRSGRVDVDLSYEHFEDHVEDGELHLFAGAGCDGAWTQRCTFVSNPVTLEQADYAADDDDGGWWPWSGDSWWWPWGGEDTEDPGEEEEDDDSGWFWNL